MKNDNRGGYRQRAQSSRDHAGSGRYRSKGDGARDRRGADAGDRFNRRATENDASGKEEVLPIDEDISGTELTRAALDSLRTLSPRNAKTVSKHLVMVHRYLYDDPTKAYRHAQAAVARASRVDVVRESLGLAAYMQGEYAQALRELRTARRLSGYHGALAVMADCERGLGRPERALSVADEVHPRELDLNEVIELGLVVAGARLDLGQPEAALAHLNLLRPQNDVQRGRVASLKAEVLSTLGRESEAEPQRRVADELLATADETLDDAMVIDLEGSSE